MLRELAWSTAFGLFCLSSPAWAQPPAVPEAPVPDAPAADGPAPATPDSSRERLAELLGLSGTRAPLTSSPRFVAFEQKELRAARLLIGWSLPATLRDPSRFEALALAISSGSPSRLSDLVKRRRVLRVAATLETLEAGRVFTIELEAAPGCRARELEDAALASLASLIGLTTDPASGGLLADEAREWLKPERRAVVELHPRERYYGSFKPRGPAQHRVERGDTLSEIAERYGLDLAALVKQNQIDPERPIRPGDKIRLSTRRTPLPKLYVVKPGDTLAKVAKRYGVSQKALLDANRLRERGVRPGQKLVLPH
jgi:LysM repeat protein